MRVATDIPGQAELEYYGANISDKTQKPQNNVSVLAEFIREFYTKNNRCK